MKKRIIAFITAGMMLLAGCSVNINTDKKESQADPAVSGEVSDFVGGGSPWIDSDLKSNIMEGMEISQKDDFYLYTNYDWLQNSQIPEGKTTVSTFSGISDIIDRKALDILDDDTVKGHDEELVKSFYKAFLDWNSRDKAGLSPVMDTVRDIEGIKSISELSDFICDPERSLFVSAFIEMENAVSYDDSESYITAVVNAPFLLGDAAEYADRTELGDRAYEAKRNLSGALLTRLGYTDDEAKRMFENTIGIESRIAKVALTNEDAMSPDYVDMVNNVYLPDRIPALSKTFPLKRMLDGYGYGDSNNYVIFEPNVIGRINELYTEENLEELKDYLMVRFLNGVADSLDSEAYDAYVTSVNTINGSSGRKEDKKAALDRTRKLLYTPMDRAFLARYDASEKKKRITKICEDVIDVYRDMLNEEDWLSEETKEKAVEKLDSITINAVYPEKWPDYDELDLSGLSLYDCMKEICRFDIKTDLTFTNKKVDHDLWSGVDILETNAYYNPHDNSINIILGLLEEPVYYDGISEEELLGALGSTIGHEISHAFDTYGAQYDKDGNYSNWWDEKDYDAFKKRADRLIAYYNSITAWEGRSIIGKNIQTEAIADMTGLKAVLKIAEGIDDFDYEKFFTAYAVFWRRLNTRESEYYCLMQDSHPLHYLRTNATLQQYEKFHETFDIKEGDRMYLAPGDRVTVW